MQNSGNFLVALTENQNPALRAISEKNEEDHSPINAKEPLRLIYVPKLKSAVHITPLSII